MKFDLIILPILLLSCYGKASPQAVWRAPNPELHESRTSHRNAVDKTKFTDLNVDVLYIIFEHLDIADLLTVFKANLTNTHSSVAMNTFRRTYRDYNIILMRAYPDDEFHNDELYQDEAHLNQIKIYKFPAALNLLQHFGCMIHKIEIQNQCIEANDSAVISRFINEYTRDSLTHLKLGYIKFDTFEYLRGPFPNVVNLSITFDSEPIKTQVNKLNDIFPNIRLLELSLHSDIDYSFIDCKFPRLERLILDVQSTAWKRAYRFISLMKQNPQIRSAEIERFPPDAVKYLDKLLPNVDTLTLYIFNDNNETVHFSHVKHFTLYTENRRFIENLSFSHLESLAIEYIPVLFDTWMRFFEKHNDLQRLNLREVFLRPNIHLPEFTAGLNDIVEVNMQYTTHDRIKDIIQFVRSHEKMMKFQCTDYGFTQDELETLRNCLEKEWTIEDAGEGIGLSFERKI